MPEAQALLEDCLSWVFRSVGVRVRVAQAPSTDLARLRDEHSMRVSLRMTTSDGVEEEAGGYVMMGDDVAHGARNLFDGIQNGLDEGAMWGRAVPPCGAHPRHPAELEVKGSTVRLRCSVDAASWYEDYPGRLDVRLTTRDE